MIWVAFISRSCSCATLIWLLNGSSSLPYVNMQLPTLWEYNKMSMLNLVASLVKVCCGLNANFFLIWNNIDYLSLVNDNIDLIFPCSFCSRLSDEIIITVHIPWYLLVKKYRPRSYTLCDTFRINIRAGLKELENFSSWQV